MNKEDEIVTGLGSLGGRVSNLEKALKDNTAATADLVAAFTHIKGAFKVAEFVGKAAKPIAYIMGIGAALAIWWSNIKAFLIR